jgi:hypothetical protein
MTRRLSRGPLLPILIVGLLLAGAGAATSERRDERAQPFPEAELFFELNDTDGDLGIHASIDGGPWTNLEIEGPNARALLDIVSRGRLRRQGMTQLFFESAEPSFDELDPSDFFRRFPEGKYEIEGRAQDGGSLESTVRLSHVLAAPPDNLIVSGVPAAGDCEAAVPLVGTPVVISWDPVTTSHPEIGKSGPVRITRYQLFVEREGVKLSLDLPTTVTEFEVPTGVTDLGDVFKWEIIARTSTGNNTAVESCFRVR